MHGEYGCTARWSPAEFQVPCYKRWIQCRQVPDNELACARRFGYAQGLCCSCRRPAKRFHDSRFGFCSNAASPFLRSFTFSITLYLSCGSRVTRSVQDPTSTASKHSSALVFSRTPSIHLCLVPLTMHRCKSSTLPVLYSTGAVKDT